MCFEIAAHTRLRSKLVFEQVSRLFLGLLDVVQPFRGRGILNKPPYGLDGHLSGTDTELL